MDRGELTRRLKAARALAGFTKPAALAAQPLMVENRIPASRIREMESLRGRVEIRPMELEIIARACGLPAEWFTAPFARLARNAAIEERLEAVERALLRVQERVPDLDALRAEAARQAAEDAAAASNPVRGGKKRPG